MTVREAIAQIQLVFPDASEETAFWALSQTHHELCSEFPIERRDDTYILSAGQREYPLPSDVVAVRSAVYATSPTDVFPLRGTTVDALDRRQPGWRFRNSPGLHPRSFYIDGGSIGLVPAPPESTSGGYPIVLASCTIVPAISIEDDLPQQVGTFDAYIEGAAYRLARSLAKEQLGVWKQLYEESKRDLERRMGGRNRRAHEVAVPSTIVGVRQI